MRLKLPANISPHVGEKLLNPVLNSGDLSRARQLFDKIPEPNLHSWANLISAYTKQNLPNEAVKLYFLFRKQNIQLPDRILLLSAAKACAAYADLTKAKEIHEDAVRFGYLSDLTLGNALINMYGKCKCCDGAQSVFNELPVKDVISWTSLLSSYVNCGFLGEALQAFCKMGLNGLRPNAVTLSSILPACSVMKCLNLGRQIHGYAVKDGFGENAFVTSALVDMYASCSCLADAQLVFDNMLVRDIVSWNVIVSAYFLNGESERALSRFGKMRKQGVPINYDSWNTVIGGCVQNGENTLALELLVQMQDEGFKPNHITITSALPACSNLESLRKGKEIHAYIFRNKIFTDITTTTALVYMYAKCGELELSSQIFNIMPRKDAVAWNTIIIANAMHGRGEEALLLFRNMLISGVKPNSITFTGVLSGCSHSKLVDEGLQVFHSMRSHLIEPDADHYSSLVDILSRAGCLDEAYGYIQRMPMKPTAGAWGALLGGCRVYKNVDLARIAAKHLFEIEPDNPGNYVLLSNIFVEGKLWNEASMYRKIMEQKQISKPPGCSWIQVKNKVHTFIAGDKSNEQSEKISKFLMDISNKVRLAGYLPNTDFVLQDLDQEEKEEVLCSHSEKLAVAFGLLNLKGESSIRVFKNLRICGDCHNFIKFAAKVVGIQIIVRDSLRFHHFKEGLCSCRDFW
ncbi:pentatricopeptide repeat-containing protein At1g20230 [Beta vulgaris subsp. vulgaris]|uniref:pentatricopeptide repeat-containing protein At1g20230 n=1 Tax=Beta vulgaris subsp. vulgaris TaxID=3555 RepID=UPI00203748A9|nr:pentatricopeptide repeat-containing protein At1g20230 [Beta vulgaris subsp. vulgaris]XP_048501759.1 pentatricopeptide repeat-containing protein At1g20230 [Beta vulgaris subsp. vulgaris]XP_057251561.1 pentatricopeptide repeat-containing protein At1g20230 [Beta vulgaris subsp. vulgaris]XP_057251562.1 pentatricopeptide repeat-containing protein At1g20230 [Beta vulgaris subsp. vulgaris]XP_057251563.1 pentatricopeptide repeat-containing protein At1g20230 [Beta vulgaris subsp. vulgaris]XP_0572515